MFLLLQFQCIFISIYSTFRLTTIIIIIEINCPQIYLLINRYISENFVEILSTKMVNILIGCTGSVACVKLPSLIQKIIEKVPGADIKVILTTTATKFINLDQIKVPVSD